ncbi:hypothetical protein [Qipengyuania soli]|uniref:Uncharacterized protein n=1 Tax=Qipengyuania soli TaxID=2782568 RepID=A0A7S8ISC3_9SPHN|nr:hypothetical protein [Qipengyuania soli]QPC97878.1 hypothetical protein IRL76_08170 [Qipengyuania soli]
MIQHEMCVIQYGDAGKSCSDSDECEGYCYAEEAGDITVAGKCSPSNVPFGCYAIVRKGKADAVMCRD